MRSLLFNQAFRAVVTKRLANSATALLALALPAQALAQCPTADDLARGILFTGAEGETELFTSGDGDTILARFRSPEGLESDAVLARGVYLMDLVSHPGAPEETRSLYAFPLLTRELPLPTPGGSFEIAAEVSVGDHAATELQSYSFGPAGEARYGDCAYEVIPVEITYSTLQGTVETYHYLPALGISYFAAVSSEMGDHTYPYIRIEALP